MYKCLDWSIIFIKYNRFQIKYSSSGIYKVNNQRHDLIFIPDFEFLIRNQSYFINLIIIQIRTFIYFLYKLFVFIYIFIY
jgi:hypothetical protein